jgi:hypothetical protein
MDNTRKPKQFEENRVGDKIVVTWRGLKDHDVGAAYSLPACRAVTAEFTGNFGSRGDAALQGSVTGGSFSTLREAAGGHMRATAPIMKTTIEAPLLVRPQVYGDEAAELVVSIVIAA